jgi:hypothetical protein
VLFGVIMAAYFRWRARKLANPRNRWLLAFGQPKNAYLGIRPCRHW